jgi:hypothetical protein
MTKTNKTSYLLRNGHGFYLCTDGEFYPERMVGIGGYTAKHFQTERGARNDWRVKIGLARIETYTEAK